MEGYLWKRGRQVPHAMKRRFAALKGTMLAFYLSQEAAQHAGATPTRVLEVVGVQAASPPRASDHKQSALLIVQYLDDAGSGVLQCRADSREAQQIWLAALQHALEEPDRLAQEEIAEAQRELQRDAESHSRAVQQAADAVQAAGRQQQEQARSEAALQQSRQDSAELSAQLDTTRVLHREAHTQLETLRQALDDARHRVHASVLASEDSPDDEQVSDPAAQEVVDRLAAQVEVAASSDATHAHTIEKLELQIAEHDRTQQELEKHVQLCMAESRSMREAAATSLEDAQRAKQRSRRLASWSSGDGHGGGTIGTPSHLDPLAEGYLLCKHPTRNSMHRRYYVLVGNTLCWYADQDAYVTKMDAPSGVVHIADVGEWDGKLKPGSPLRKLIIPSFGSKVVGSPTKANGEAFPHTFSVITVEGKTLQCSAPMRQSRELWISALHVGLTMPPLSPHRAVAAKARRDSFDLLASTTFKLRRRASFDGEVGGEKDEETTESPPSPSGPRSTSLESSSRSIAEVTTSFSLKDGSKQEFKPPGRTEATEVVVEGYLVKKSSLAPVMKNKYCVLTGLVLRIFASHTEADAFRASAPPKKSEHSFHVSGVSDWDGHAALMHYHHGFQLQTVEHHSIYCSASTTQDKARWLRGVHEALLHHHSDDTPELALSDLSPAGEETKKSKSQSAYTTARREFLVVLQRFYAEHHPSKLGDVPMLLSRYQRREQALVEHLDRLYGTAMAQDDEVQTLLKTLAGPTPGTPPQRPSLRESGPSSPAARSASHISGWLTWNIETPASFCVLTGPRLERFASQESRSTGSPLTVFLVAGVHDYPASSPSAKSSDQQLRFFLSGVYENAKQKQAEGAASTVLLVLETTTMEAKQRWMAKLRSGLGLLSETQTQTPAAAASPSRSLTSAFRKKLIGFYEQHNPRHVDKVDALLACFAGRERQLLASLDATYATNVSSDSSFEALLSASPVLNSSQSDPDAEIHHEGYLWVKHPQLGADSRKCFCVLSGSSWKCFDNSSEAHREVTAQTPLLDDVVVSVHAVTAKLVETQSFHLETQTSGVITLHTEVPELVHDWTQALHAVVVKQQQKKQQTVEEGEVEEDEDESASQRLHDLLTSFFEKHNPAKCDEVSTLLHGFQHREMELLEQLDAVYKSHLATHSLAKSLVAELAAQYTKEAEQNLTSTGTAVEAEVTQNTVVLMEGYLLKRGHRIPAMRKRYCVLVGDELSYFATHDDSRNDSGGVASERLGSFHVEIVGEWSGKTSTHTYEHGLELETSDGKAYFCAVASTQEKQQWLDAFHHGIALARSKRQGDISYGKGVEGHDEGDPEHGQLQREHFREKLAQFYREKNPAKIADLELLLSCYSGREMAMLQAIDQSYGTALATDESLLALLPPPPEQATALETLKLDGFLKRTSGDSSSSSMWKRAQSVYVALDRLTLSFFASREGFKSGGAGMGEAATILALKDSDEHHPPSPRFAVETSEHQWLRFEARDSMEKRLWVQVIRAALDAVLAQSLLAEEQRTVQEEPHNRVADTQGFLLVRLDFTCSQEEHWRKRLNPVLVGERYVTLTNSNELVIYKDKDKVDEQVQFQVASTRAWTPGTNCWPVAAGHREPRFPFQIVTQEQYVLSCSATTDVERAWWIRHLRLGAEQAAALEMLEEQLLETKAPLSPGRRSWREAQKRGSKSSLEDGEVMVPLHLGFQTQSSEDEPPMTGYLPFRLAKTPPAAGGVILSPQTGTPLREAFVVLTMRAHVSLYEDEATYFRREQPICTGQAVELLREGSTSVGSPTHSSKPSSRLRQLFPGIQADDAQIEYPVPLAFAVLLLPLDAQVPVDDNTTGNVGAKVLELFPPLASQRETWLEGFASRIDFVRGEALLADEKLLMKLEQDDVEHDKEAESEANVELEMKPAAPPEGIANDGDASSFAFRSASMEGSLTPWQTSSSPIRLPGSSKMKPVDNVYAVLVGCQLRCFPSKEAAQAAAAGSEDAKPSLDVEVAAFSSWEAPIASWLAVNKTKEGLGFQVDVVGSRYGVCFMTSTVESKRQWLHVIQHELDFALAERYLDEDAREFTRDVEAHLAATSSSREVDRNISGVSGSSDVDRHGEDTAGVARTEGYLRVRHHNLGSVWHERYAVLADSTLAIFADSSVVKTHANHSNSFTSALETHEIVGVAKWHPTFSGFGRGDAANLKRSGFRVETSAGGFLECTAASDEDGNKWRHALADATTKTESGISNTASRDAALPFIPGARMEGYLKLKEPSSSRKLEKLAALQPWKSRYCVVLGAHWLVYASQKQAVSTSEDPLSAHPVAVHELLGVAALAGEEDDAGHEFAIAVAAGGHVHCRSRSSLERKRWLHAIQDELQSDEQTGAELSRSQVAREEKQAARAAVKSKLQEVQSDARRQSLLLGEALQFARDSNSDSDWDSERDNSDGKTSENDGQTTLRQRTRSDYIDCSPESSPMRRHLAEKAFAFEAADGGKPRESSGERQQATTSFTSVFACVFRCLPLGGVASGSSGRNAVAPLGVPGFPSTAAACSAQYTCDYYQADGYEADGYRGLAD